MNFLLAVIVSALCTWCTATTALDLVEIPIGKEWIYHYHAEVHVGLHQPDHSESTFQFKGNLHCQKLQENLVNFYLADLKHNLYNGRVTPERALQNETWGPHLSVPAEVQSLTIPFQIVYDDTGKFNELLLDPIDKEFSVNIKKSIASIFQIDEEIVNSFTGKTIMKNVPEDTIYGACDVRYHMFSKDDNLMLIKTFEPENCDNRYHLQHDTHFMSLSNNRVYQLEKVDDQNVRVRKIQANGQLVTYPQAGLDGVQFVKTTQHLTLTDETSTTGKELPIDNPQIVKTLKYTEPQVKCRDLALNTLFDMTGGRRLYRNSDEVIAETDNFLTNLNNYLNENHISFDKAALEHIRVVGHALLVLEHAPLETMQEYFNILQEKSRTDRDEANKLYTFVQMLPHVGTPATAILIRNLIRKQKIDNDLALMVLQDVPEHLKCPSEKLLIELEDMLSLHEQDPAVHSALILTYASLVRKTFEHFDEKSTMLEKYITYFMDKMNAADDYKSKVLYLQALSNINIGSVFTQLLPLVTGEIVVPENLRVLALQAVASHLQKRTALMYKIVVPILANADLGITLRATAYNIYINTNPSYGSFMRLHRMLKREPCEKFYAFHYNTLKSLNHLGASSFEGIKPELAGILLRISRHPINDRLIDNTFIHEYFDSVNGFGAQVRDILVDNDKEIVLQSRMLVQLKHDTYEQFAIFLRIVRKNKGVNPFGVEDPVPDEIKQANPMMAFSLQYELIVQKAGQTVMVRCGNVVTFDLLKSVLRTVNILLDNRMNFHPVIAFPYKYEKIIPTDLGVPLTITDYTTVINSLNVELSQDEKLHVNVRLTGFVSRVLNMKVYNPVQDAYHFIINMKSAALDLPLNMVIGRTAERKLTVSFKKSPVTDSTGLQTYAVTNVIVGGAGVQETIAALNNGAKIYQPVLGQAEYKEKIPIADVTLKGIGKRMEAGFFNCTRNVSRGTFIDYMMSDDGLDDSDVSLPLFLTLIQQHLTVTPGVENCGLNIQFHDLPDVDSVELELHLGYVNLADIFDVNMYENEASMSTMITLATKSANDGEIVKQTLAMETNFMAGKFEHMANISAHLIYKREENHSVKTRIFAHFDHQEHNNRYETKIQFDVDGEKSVLDVNIRTLLSEEQERMARNKNFIYRECYRQTYKNQVLLPYSYHCARVASSLNKHSIDITVKNRKSGFVSLILRALRALRSKYVIYRHPIHQSIDFVGANTYHVDLVYPIDRKELDVQVKIGDARETYQGIPREKNNIIADLFDPSSVLWDLNLIDYRSNIVENIRHCLVNGKYILTDKYNLLSSPVTKKYTTMLHGLDVNNTAIFTVSVGFVNDTDLLGIKLEIDNQTVEIMPKDNVYVINKRKITPNMGIQLLEFGSEKAEVVVTPYPKLFVMSFTTSYHLLIIFDDKTVRLEVAHIFVARLEGKCIE